MRIRCATVRRRRAASFAEAYCEGSANRLSIACNLNRCGLLSGELRHPTSSGARLNRSKDYTEATAAPVAYYGLLDASGGQVGARRLPRHQVCSAVLVAAGDSGKLALSHLRVGNDTLSPSRSSLAIVSHMCGSAGSSQHRARAAERAMPGGRGPFLQVAFFLITAFGQATLNQVRLGQASCVDPRPK